MRYVEASPLPQACQDCTEVKECLARGEGEWCCDECDHLGERFIPVPDTPFHWDYVEKNGGAHNETGYPLADLQRAENISGIHRRPGNALSASGGAAGTSPKGGGKGGENRVI